MISLDVDAVLCHVKTVHTCARSKMPQHNIVNNVFPMTGFKATECASTGENRHNCAEAPEIIP